MTEITPAAIAIAADLARHFEGCELAAYQNAHDVPTIGYGHTNGVRLGDACSQAQADAWLVADLERAAAAVVDAVTRDLTDNQAAALVDFVYNLGQGNFDASTLLRDINAGSDGDVPLQLLRWTHSGGQVLPGLVKRRQAEADLWNTADGAS